MPSALSPARGYVVTLSQVVGGRPRLSVSCSACHFLDDTTPVPLEATTDDEIGAIVRVALLSWEAHMCEDTYPNDGDRLPPCARGDAGHVPTVSQSDGALYCAKCSLLLATA